MILLDECFPHGGNGGSFYSNFVFTVFKCTINTFDPNALVDRSQVLVECISYRLASPFFFETWVVERWNVQSFNGSLYKASVKSTNADWTVGQYLPSSTIQCY